MNLTHTISILEVLWTIPCLIALFYFQSLFRRAMNDMRWLRNEHINGNRRDAARIPIVVFGMLTTIWTLFTMLGVFAMIIPPANRASTSPLAYVTAFAFISASVSAAIGAKYVESLRSGIVKRIMAGIYMKAAQEMEDDHHE